MTAIVTSETKGWLQIDLAGVVATTGGAIASVANPEGTTLIPVQAVLYVTTASTGAANISIGIGATATTSATDFINALAINGVSVPAAYNGPVLDAKTALPAVWTTTSYLTVTGSADSSGFVGKLYVQYIRP